MARAQVRHWSTISIKSELRLAPDKPKSIATCPKDKLEFKFFFQALVMNIATGYLYL